MPNFLQLNHNKEKECIVNESFLNNVFSLCAGTNVLLSQIHKQKGRKIDTKLAYVFE